MAAEYSASATCGSIDRHVISPSLLKLLEIPKPGYKPRSEFLLGLGEPFEPNPWDLDTNHSLRATAATRLFEAGVDEQLIMQRTGAQYYCWCTLV